MRNGISRRAALRAGAAAIVGHREPHPVWMSEVKRERGVGGLRVFAGVGQSLLGCAVERLRLGRIHRTGDADAGERGRQPGALR